MFYKDVYVCYLTGFGKFGFYEVFPLMPEKSSTETTALCLMYCRWFLLQFAKLVCSLCVSEGTIYATINVHNEYELDYENSAIFYTFFLHLQPTFTLWTKALR